MINRRIALALGCTPLLPRIAWAAWPERPIRWLVATAPGGGSDILARLLGSAMSPRLGQPVLVENRPGAASNIAAEATARAAPDGYTVFTADNGTLIFNPVLFRRLPYNPETDFRPIGLFARFHLVLAVKAASPIRTVQDYIAAARREPGKLDYGSSGVGSPHHIAMERFQRMMGIKLNHIPYRGGAPGLSDLIAGNLESQLVDFATGAEAIRSGQVRALAVASAQCPEFLPKLPTFAEAGATGFEAYAWQGLVTTAATPDAMVERLSAELRAAKAQEAVRRRMIEIGVEPLEGGPAEFAALIARERAIWAPIVRDMGVTLDT